MALLQAAPRTLLLATARTPARLMATKSRPPLRRATPLASMSSKPVPERTDFKVPAQPSPAVASDPTDTSTRALLPSLDFDPSSSPLGAAAGGGGRTGARSALNSPSSIERKRKNLGRVSLALAAAGLVGGWIWMGREWEEREAELRRDSELAGINDDRVGRANARIGDLLDYFNKPLSKEILPKPQHKPYTLLLSLDDLLITSTWDRQNGWRTAKRPGVDYFIAYLSQFYEVVVFTSQHHYTAIPVVEQLDPYGQFIIYRLFREYTRSIKGKIVKDLAYLNRDLSKVILIDTHPDHIAAQPENAILLPKWTGDPKDKGLIGLIPFLESIGIMHPPDVRPVLKAYEGKDIASTFALMEAESKRRVTEQWEKKHGVKRGAAPSGGVARVSLGSLFGGSAAPAVDHSQPPPTYLEMKRKEAQEYYLREQQWLKENEPELQKIIEADKAAQMAEMGGGTLLGALTGASFKPPPAKDGPAAEGTVAGGVTTNAPKA